MYYKLAATEYGAAWQLLLQFHQWQGVASSCVFYDVTQGDMDVNCTGTNNCYRPSGTNGGWLNQDTELGFPRDWSCRGMPSGTTACFPPPAARTRTPMAQPPAGTSPPESARSTPTTWRPSGHSRSVIGRILYDYVGDDGAEGGKGGEAAAPVEDALSPSQG